MCTNTHKSIEVRKENKIKLNFEKSDVAFKTSNTTNFTTPNLGVTKIYCDRPVIITE